MKLNSVERSGHFLLGARASIITEDRELAWAEKFVRQDQDIKWVLGNFVEADNANSNGHIFPLEDLKAAQTTIPNKPMNMLHHGNYIVGAFTAVEMMWPEGSDAETSAKSEPRPYIEALAAFWRTQFPEEFAVVERAHKEGHLYFSMETIPESLNCTTEGCEFKEKAVAYDGRNSDTYCKHMNAPRGEKILNKPHFGAGALIVPPVKPGWNRADINELSTLLNQHADEAEAIYANLEDQLPHLDAVNWEAMMQRVMLEARDVSPEERKKLEKKGAAMPGGRYPIVSVQDLKNAIQAYGRGNPDDLAAVKSHIIKRARALGRTDLLPEGWA